MKRLTTNLRPTINRHIRTFQTLRPPHASVDTHHQPSAMSGAEQQPPPTASHQAPQPDYSTWSPSSLISRITELERQLHTRTAPYTGPPPPPPQQLSSSTPSEPSPSPTKKLKRQSDDITHAPAPSKWAKKKMAKQRSMDPSRYHTRFIALKFAYLGQRYNGLEHSNGNTTQLPTIEEELYRALRKLRLIFPDDTGIEDGFWQERRGPRENRPYFLNFEGCDYSKAGRTDRGVSAFGQVIGIRVRSSRPMKNTATATTTATADTAMRDVGEAEEDDGWDDIADEIPYVYQLNQALPEDIRVLAWCPNPPEGFSARFSCRERQYKYFFTQPAFFPTPGPSGFNPRGRNENPKYREGFLDIDAMREAAKSFEGVHDFRNFCKLDTSKQLTNFERKIFHSDIELVDPNCSQLSYLNGSGFQPLQNSENPSTDNCKVYVFHLQGSAFLWHQVRHMVSILFLVGQGLEPPSIVSEMLDITKNPRKPVYDMASDAPLVLWDCIFPDEKSGSREDSLNWIYAGDPRRVKLQLGAGGEKYGLGGVSEGLWSVWRQRKIDEVLAGSLLNLAISQGDPELAKGEVKHEEIQRGQKVFTGSGDNKIGGKYIPLMQRDRTQTVEVQNAKWLATRERRNEREAAAGKMDM